MEEEEGAGPAPRRGAPDPADDILSSPLNKGVVTGSDGSLDLDGNCII